MKKTISLLLLICLLFVLTACGGGKSGEVSDESSEVEETSVRAIPESIAINGRDISEFRIVYRETNIPARYKTAAYELRDFVKENWGVSLVVMSELDNAREVENEIFVGMIDGRELCEEYFYQEYEYGDYTTVVSGSKVLFASGYANGAHFAVEEFCESLLNGDGTVSDMKKSGKGEVLRVACVGDSITQGINSEDKLNKTYPVYIQEMLGLDYYVLNYGLSGYSICKTDEYAYWKSQEYRKSLAFEPDIVIFALGTNDCNPGQDYKAWEGTNREEVFIESTKGLLDSYLELETKPQIYICLPCSLFKVGSDIWNALAWTDRVEKYSLPLLKQIADDYGLPTVDLYTWSKAHPEVFTDGLHPKDETYKDFAQAIYDQIKDTVRTKEA